MVLIKSKHVRHPSWIFLNYFNRTPPNVCHSESFRFYLCLSGLRLSRTKIRLPVEIKSGYFVLIFWLLTNKLFFEWRVFIFNSFSVVALDSSWTKCCQIINWWPSWIMNHMIYKSNPRTWGLVTFYVQVRLNLYQL